jgi:outer membrane protein assembly factor BamB
MRNLSRIILGPAALAAAGLAALLWWGRAGEGLRIDPRVPGMDRSGGAANPLEPSETSLGALESSGGVPGGPAGSWSRFRGDAADGVSAETVPLARAWGPAGPPALWTVDVGEGYAGAAVKDGRVYLLDYDHAKQADALRCLSLADGKEIWRYAYPVKLKRNHGVSRTVPAVTDRFVVSIGPKCHVLCLDAKTGERRWMIDMVRDFGAEVPQWYSGQCPLVDGGRVILAPGGRALLAAIDIDTGKVAWETPKPDGWRMTHSSIAAMEVGG